MKMRNQDNLGKERRRYIRLDSVFPVGFRFVSPDGKEYLSDLLQGFTNNVGKGGLCLVINNLDPQLANYLKNQQAKLSLDIEMPLTADRVAALAKVAWVKEAGTDPIRYFVGLSYEKIASAQNNRIMAYAWTKKLFLPVVLSIIFILGLGFGINSFISLKLIQGNKALVKQLVDIVQESSIAKQKIKEIAREREGLLLKIQALELRMKTAEEERSKSIERAQLEADRKTQKIVELNALSEQLAKEKDSLQQQLIDLQSKENTITEDLLRLDKRKFNLEKANLDNMYKWLKVHQNPRTGLVMSFEGDKDIQGWAFTYDQSLLIQLYGYFSDFERSRKILDFFNTKAKKENGLFFNAYYVDDTSPAEYIVHSGPNIWLGISIMQYTKKSGDTRYLKLAKEIAAAIIALQNQDADQGIRGGPKVEWFSTEHNLDAYAFFNMLYKMTDEQKYLDARDKVLNWLIKHAYDQTDVPIKRGKGDSTIATDTYAWSIAAIGPQTLEEIGMNPDQIIEFAEENCSVGVSYARPEGDIVKVKGFDFASQRHLARGGVISSEWTAQMILAFKIMSDFYYKKDMVAKARSYGLKADEYLAELSKMIISSPSPSGQGESCLPYATDDLVDTGHGWSVPQGKTTGSVAGTAHALFAYYNYNPLELKD